MKRFLSHYYIMAGLSLAIAIILMYSANSDRSIAAILFNSLLVSIPIFFAFLFVDYTFSLTGWHKVMKVFYVLVALVVTVSLPNLPDIPLIEVISSVSYIALAFFMIGVIVMFFMYAFRGGHEELQSNPHPIHKLADAYQKQKENPKSWEEQLSDFFTQKFSDYSSKRGNEEKVNV